MHSSGSQPGSKGNHRKGNSAASGNSRFKRRVNDSKGRSRSDRPDWQPKESRGAEQAFRTRGGGRPGAGRPGAGRDDRRGGRYESDDRGGSRGGERGGFRGDRRNDRGDDRRGGFREDRGGFRGDKRNDRNDDRGGFRGDRRNDRNDDRGGFRGDRRNDRNDDRGGFRGGRGGDDRGGSRGSDRGGFRNDRRNDRSDDRRGGFRDDRDGFRGDRRNDRNDDRGGFRTDRRNDRNDDRGGFRGSDRNADRGGFRGRGGDERRRGEDRGGYRGRGGNVSSDRSSRAERPQHHVRTDRTSKGYVDDTVHERLEATAIDSSTVASDFAALGLGDGIVRALTAQGVTSPFPIQSGTIPASLEGRHVLGRASTGSGKTVAFGAPVVELLMRTKSKERRVEGRSPRALIVAPTRELAEQINRTVFSLAREVGLFTVLITGGTGQQPQVASLRKGVDIVIGTPGRMEDLIDQGRLNLGRVEIAVLDEADHMAELGFIEPVGRLLRQTHPDSQKLLFSATLDREVESLVKEFLTDPAIYEAADLEQTNDQVEHTVLVADRHDKDAVLTNLAAIGIKSVFFTRTRAYADRLADQFIDDGIRATAMHGDLSQARRTRGLEKLRRGKIDVLVATDVAARGIHVDEIELVVQADPPDDHKAYVHRAGRTGRAGASGHVVTVIAPSRRRRMQELLDRAEREVVMIPVDATSDLEGILGLGRSA